jgi:hypothetical protein
MKKLFVFIIIVGVVFLVLKAGERSEAEKLKQDFVKEVSLKCSMPDRDCPEDFIETIESFDSETFLLFDETYKRLEYPKNTSSAGKSRIIGGTLAILDACRKGERFSISEGNCVPFTACWMNVLIKTNPEISGVGSSSAGAGLKEEIAGTKECAKEFGSSTK